MDLGEATIKALQGKLTESKTFSIGNHNVKYDSVQDLCDMIAVMIECYYELDGERDIISYISDGKEDVITDEPKAEYNIEFATIDSNLPAWEASSLHYIPIKDEQEALNIIKDIVSFCEEENIDLDKFFNDTAFDAVLKEKLLREDEEDNTPIEGQISFDDMEKEAEEEKKGKYIYETNFRLECPVNDFDEAYAYLTEDDMVQYLGDASPEDNCVTSIEWILEDEVSGKIVVRSTRELSEGELDIISNWIGGQNSDGLGEGFEQQDFAESYFNPETGDGPYTRREAEREVERLWEDISVNDLIDNGYLDNAMYDAIEVYKDQNGTYDDNNDEELSDDEIWDIIAADPESYLDWDSIEDAKNEYVKGSDEYNENEWFVMASFDWKTNNYKLHRVD